MKYLMILLLTCPWVVGADIFDDPKNLKVLSEDISPVDLRRTMRMMAKGLGVRCQHCHVGEEGQSLREFDFASDDKNNKEKARFMLKMMMDLNQHMVTGIKDREVEIQCITCHRGSVKPWQTVDVLKQKLIQEGVAAALSHHDELKAEYYGSHTHDFTPQMLNDLAAMVSRDHPQAVIPILQKNLTMHPKHLISLVNLGDAYVLNKEPKKALKYYKKASKVDDQPWLEQKIKAVKEQL
ncbi:c-type cytochrome [Marinicella meishanensis]|uniref:c-type cytochrome n=1 Tax=Marinicella meishanensis TaxID=2873263 RepID=UPI001CBCA1CF|nr:c-type cytochrome [Marinicella sp. NBU2979]